MQYEGWVNPYGANMGDLIARSGDAQAHAAEMIAAVNARAAAAKAQAWGGAVQNIAQIPAQMTAARNAEVDQKLKQETLAQTIEQRKAAQQQKIVTTIGRLAGGSKSADDFVSGLNDMAGLGALPPDVAKHITAQVQAAGPDGWAGVQDKYVQFGSQYDEAVKLGKDDRLVTRGGKTLIDTKPEILKLTPGMVAAQPGENGAPATTVASAPFAPSQTTAVVNGTVVPLAGPTAGQPIAPAVPPQEKPSEVGLNNAKVDEINKKIEEMDNVIAGSMPISQKDRAELAIQRQRLEVERSHYKAIESGQDINSPKNQERLEESYRSLLKTTQSSRSGGMGLEDKKVDQAKHLLALLDQTRAKDGSYSLTPTQQTELSMGLATLISPTGVPSDSARNDINAATASGDLAKLGTYITGTPFAGTPQKIAELLRESIERQGVQAEQNREGHFNQLRAFAPTDLEAGRRDRLEKGLIGANRLSVEVDGFRFPTQRAADEYQKAKAAKQ